MSALGDNGLGDLLNTVRDSVCPVHDRPEQMKVYVIAVVWACGHQRNLPPLPSRAVHLGGSKGLYRRKAA